ncbi:MAG TPA: type II secretion system protein, partial [Candidatus Baltobacteraceae bacterium]
MRHPARQRGLSLVELTVAIGIAVVVTTALFFALQHFMRWNALLDQRDNEHAAIEMLVDRWQAEADSAWSIFTPPTDVNGRPNADGHELDFFTRDGSSRDYFWAYDYDKKAQSLQKYLYASPGSTPQADGDAIEGVTQFFASTLPVTDLQNVASPIYNGLFAGAALKAESIHFGYGQSVAGGNQITYVRVQGPTLARTMELTTQTAPSGFTIVFHYTPAPSPTSIVNVKSPKYVCSTSPAGTDLGPDKDGWHEDISNGQACSGCASVGQSCSFIIEATVDGMFCDPSSGQFGGTIDEYSARLSP